MIGFNPNICSLCPAYINMYLLTGRLLYLCPVHHIDCTYECTYTDQMRFFSPPADNSILRNMKCLILWESENPDILLENLLESLILQYVVSLKPVTQVHKYNERAPLTKFFIIHMVMFSFHVIHSCREPRHRSLPCIPDVQERFVWVFHSKAGLSCLERWAKPNSAVRRHCSLKLIKNLAVQCFTP